MKKLHIQAVVFCCLLYGIFFPLLASAQAQNVKEIENRLLKKAEENRWKFTIED